MTTKITGSVLANTAVTIGTYGGTTQHTVVTVDQQGRVIFAANATPSIANTQITGLITSAQIATVANTQITGLITSGQIATVSTTQLTGTITNAQLAGSITSDKISSVANTSITGTITNAQLAGSITSDKIISLANTQITGTITNAQLAGSITSDKIVSLANTQISGTVRYSQLSSDVTNTLLPTGIIQMWPTSTPPTGFLNCAGAAVSRTTYAALFAVIGTTFGSGDGSTTFNLPNYTNRMPYGTTIGATGGSADAIVVSHSHTASSSVSDPGHVHGPGAGGSFNSAENYGQGGRSDANQGLNFSTTAAATTGISVSTTVNSTGSSATNANLPPYLGINFIIKT